MPHYFTSYLERISVISSIKVKDAIHEEFRDAKIYIIIDELHDEFRKEQVVIDFRFANKTGFRCERFFSVVHIQDFIA